jgi:hypothetical protein
MHELTHSFIDRSWQLVSHFETVKKERKASQDDVGGDDKDEEAEEEPEPEDNDDEDGKGPVADANGQKTEDTILAAKAELGRVFTELYAPCRPADFVVTKRNGLT